MSLCPSGRTVVAWHRFGPYHCARLRATAQRLDVLGLEVSNIDKVNGWAPVEHTDGFERRTLLPGRDADLATSAELSRMFDGALAKEPVAAVAVHGWSARSSLGLLRWTQRHRVPAVLMSESTAIDMPRVAHRELVKQRLLGFCATALVGGTRQADYLVDLGFPRERIFLGYDAVDNAHFARGAAAARAEGAAQRRRLGLPGRYFLASARFVPKKNLLRLLDAYAIYRRSSDGQAWPLLLVGDGKMRPEIEARRLALGLEGSVLLAGYQQYETLPAYYGHAGAFVHASTSEQWGLVVNEAMASGLAVLVSNRCGCAADLVHEGSNGFTFDPYDTHGLAILMNRVAHGGTDLAAMGAASRSIVAAWGPERFASGIESAVRVALEGQQLRAGRLDRFLLAGMSRGRAGAAA